MSSFDTKKFKKPSKEYEIVYCWLWNAPITKEAIDSQMEDFVKAGIKAFYILPEPIGFRPERIRTFLFPEYLSKEYLELYAYAAKKAEALNLNMWIYDEGGWPSGGSCGITARENPKAVETVLKKVDKDLEKGEAYSLPNNALAVFTGTKRLENKFLAEEQMTVTEYYAEKTNDTNPNRIDSTNRNVVNTFINNSYEKYYNILGDRYGKDIPIIFTDEPSVIKGIIPENFFELFKEKYGYTLLEYLPCLLNPQLATAKKQMQARIDYGRLVGELFVENYVNNLSNWCKEHNIKFGGHLDIDHLAEGGTIHQYFSHLHALSSFSVPGIDVIWNQIRYPENNREIVTEGYPFFPRIASSAAHQNGGNLALSESLAVYGDGMSHDVMRFVLNYQAIRGINTFNIFLLSFNNSRCLALVERPSFTPEKPGFYHLKNFNTYYSRLSYLTRLGEPLVDTALYHPCADFWANPDVRNAAVQSFTAEGNRLEEKNIQFDIIDDYAIRKAEATTEGLKIGNILYKHIVVPNCEFMPEDVAKKIKPYISTGGNSLLCTEPDLKIMARKTKDATLWFIFNQGINQVKKVLNIGENNLYKLELQSGEVVKAEKAEILLPCGAMAVFLDTKKEFETKTEKIEGSIEITDFTLIKAKKFTFDYSGISLKEIPLEKIPEKDFSGELTYKAFYSFDSLIKANGRYRLRLENTSSTADIRINGKLIADFGMTPKTAIVYDLPQKAEIEITIANTAADEILAKQHIANSFPPAEVGPYNKRSIEFEKSAPKLCLGKLIIEKFAE